MRDVLSRYVSQLRHVSLDEPQGGGENRSQAYWDVSATRLGVANAAARQDRMPISLFYDEW